MTKGDAASSVRHDTCSAPWRQVFNLSVESVPAMACCGQPAGCAMLDSPFKLKRELPRQNETLDIAIPGSTKDGQAARIPLLALSGLDEEGFPCKPEARARESVLRTQQNRSNPVINE